MIHLASSFKFHPVGFGLFTSGKIGNFRFVYDCGSKSKTCVNNCVESEFPELERIRLDLLSISHFHFDHISGLKKLLESVEKIDTIILPYYTPRERLIYILALINNSGDFIPNGWEFDFLKDPVGYLITNFNERIGEIILIKGGNDYLEDNTKQNNTLDKDIPDIELENLEIDFDELEDSDENQQIKEDEGIESSKVYVKKYGSVKLRTSNSIPIWQFVFYYPPLTEKAILYFNQILAKAKLNSINAKSDLDAIVNDVSFDRIAKKTKMHGKDINNTSLTLYHSPLCKHELFAWSLLACMFNNSPFHIHYFIPINYSSAKGFFYSGDIDFNIYHLVLDNYYNRLLDQICVFQVPHHGSIENWRPSISNRNQGALHIVSSKLSNNRRLHPNPKILHSIAANNGLFFWCNESNMIEIEFVLANSID